MPARTRNSPIGCSKVANRTGATLIDVAVGSMLLTLLLIPSVQWIGRSQSMNRRLDDRDAMLFEAEQLIETLKVQLSDSTSFDAASSAPIDETVTVASASGKPFLAHYQVSPDKTLLSAKLLDISVNVWYDANRNGRLESNETNESLRTQWAGP